MEAGHRLRVVLAATDLGYASPAAPASYTVGLAGGALSVPTAPGVSTRAAALPWWVWGIPAGGAVAAAGLLLTTRRRSAAPAPDPALADVPLTITGLTKRYSRSADRYAVQDLSFRVEKGQVLGLLGPNGAGKTTTLRMLMGLISPDGGEIRVFGHAVRPGAPVLSRVGAFVEGAGFLPHLSGRENLELYWRATGRPAADAHIDEALEIAGLGDALARAVRTYSQGMRQRLAIAQAMLGLPDLLILDEPTNGLDPPQIREMRDVMVRYAAAGRTVIVSSHLLAEVEQSCTHLVVMDQGRLVQAGPVADIVGSGDTLLVTVAGTLPDAVVDKVGALAGRRVRHPRGGRPARTAGRGHRERPRRRTRPARRAGGRGGAAPPPGGRVPHPDRRRRIRMTPLLDAAPGYRARHTLPLRVEAVRQLKRRRTYVMGAVLAALPFVLIAAFAIGGDDRDGPDNRITLMDTATASGLNFAATCLFVSAGFLLVIPVALFCGDTVASEAGWSSLRYLLAAPSAAGPAAVVEARRGARLQRRRHGAAAGGRARRGHGRLRVAAAAARRRGAGRRGRRGAAGGRRRVRVRLPTGHRRARVLAVDRTDAPLGAVGGAVGLTIVGNVLDAVTALGDWRDLLPAHWQYAWIDALQPHLEWSGMAKGAAVSTGYALVLFALAFRGFARKDIVS